MLKSKTLMFENRNLGFVH